MSFESISAEYAPAIRLGLSQLPLDGLQRLHQKLLRGDPILLNGNIYTESGGYG